jgi:hypothetical protein
MKRVGHAPALRTAAPLSIRTSFTARIEFTLARTAGLLLEAEKAY